MSEKIKVQHAIHIFDVSGQTHGEVNHDIDKMEVWDEKKKVETGGKKHWAWENYDVILVRTYILFILHLIYLWNVMYTLNLFLDYEYIL